MRCLFAFLTISIVIACGASTVAVETRPVTVPDIIGMTIVRDPADGSVAKFSPDGRLFAVIVRRGDLASDTVQGSILIFATADLSKNTTRTVAVRFASSSNRPPISKLRWLNNMNLIFLAENPNTLPQVYTYDIRSKMVQKRTDQQTAIEAYDSSADGGTIAYSAGAPQYDPDNEQRRKHGFVATSDDASEVILGKWGSQKQLYSTNLFIVRHGQRTPIMAAQPNGYVCQPPISVSPNGRYVVQSCEVSQGPSNWLEYNNVYVRYSVRHDSGNLYQCLLTDATTGKTQPLLDAPILYAPCEVTWTADSRAAIVPNTFLPLDTNDPSVRKQRAENRAVAYVDLQSGSVTPMLMFDELKLGAGDFVAVKTYDASKQRATLQAYDDVMRKVQVHRTSKGWVLEQAPTTSSEFIDPAIGSASPDGRFEVKLEQGMNEPPRLVAERLSNSQRTIVLDPNPQFGSLQFGTERIVKWRSKDGAMWTGGIYYPVGYQRGQRYPLIIQTHGFSDELFTIDGPFPTAFAAQAFAGQGFFVLQIGDGPAQNSWEATPRWGRTISASYEGAIDQLAREGLVDPNEVGLIGFSVTCYEVEYFLTHSHYPIAAASITEGFDLGYLDLLLYPNPEFEQVYGSLPWGRGSSSWRQQAPGFNADRVHTPLRISALSPSTILTNWEIFSALRRLNKPVEFMYLPDGSHELIKPLERLNSLEGNLEWFSFWLEGKKISPPLDDTEYSRWQSMRQVSTSHK